jgi:hypothetical protein
VLAEGQPGSDLPTKTTATDRSLQQAEGEDAGQQQSPATVLQAVSAAPPRQREPSEAALAAAAAALAAARTATSVGAARTQGKVTVTETRRFAGKDIQVGVFMMVMTCYCPEAVINDLKGLAPQRGAMH